MLRDSVVVVRTRPRAIPLAMITMRKQLMGFLLFPIYGLLMGLRLAVGAPLLKQRSYNLAREMYITKETNDSCHVVAMTTVMPLALF